MARFLIKQCCAVESDTEDCTKNTGFCSLFMMTPKSHQDLETKRENQSKVNLKDLTQLSPRCFSTLVSVMHASIHGKLSYLLDDAII